MRYVNKLDALNEGGWMDFSHNHQPKCPHCGDYFDISDNEAWRLYDDNDRHEVECPRCEMTFTVISHSQWSFSTDEQEEE